MIQWSWRIEDTVSILCGSWSQEHLWEPTFDLLRNKVVVELSVVGRLPEIVVALTEGLYVSSFMTAEGDPQWSLFDRRGGTLRTLRVVDGSLKIGVEDFAGHYEIITRAVEASFVHKKIIGGGGEFAKVILRLEPLPGGSGLKFTNNVADAVIPAKLVDGVREGVQEASKTGVLAGHPVTDLRVTLVGGAYHDVDSDRRTFSLAARGAFWDGMRKAGPKIQKP
jgi:hypothetical protein